MDHTKLESIFHKKHAPHIYAHHPQHTPHVHYNHTHSYMYAKVYISTHCGRKNHLARFCYDRLNFINFANNNVWVRKGANHCGPNMIWVPKFTLIVFDIGVGSHLT